LRKFEPGFATAEWGFTMGSDSWGTGIFMDAGRRVVGRAIETVGVHRLEARAAVANGRGNGALRKLGAVQEGILRRSFKRNGQYLDQVLWSILHDEWRQAKAVWGPRIH
jgi:RimJ/RimL family protein N-acetyltransferase